MRRPSESRVLLVAIAGLCLAGVPFLAHAEKFKKVMDKWLGASREELVAVWGYPDGSHPAGGASAYTYVFRTCTIRFFVDDGIVRQYQYRGSHCPKKKRIANFQAKKQAPDSGAESSVSQGTGWVTDGGYVITAAHVVGDKTTVKLHLTNKKLLSASVVAKDDQNDVAVLRADSPDALPPGLPLSRAFPSLGAEVLTVGYPLTALMGTEPKLANGIISATTGFQDDPRLYQTSLPVQQGNSGGALVNMQGEVVGLVVSKLSALAVLKVSGGDLPENVCYAIKSQYISALLDSAPKGRSHRMQPRTKGSTEQIAGRIKTATILITAE